MEKWIQKFINLEINKYQTQVSTILENYNDTISEIRETTTTSIQENYENLSEEISGIYTQVEKTIDEQAKAIPAQILQGWEELTKKGKALINQKEQIEAYAQDVINR